MFCAIPVLKYARLVLASSQKPYYQEAIPAKIVIIRLQNW